MNHASSMNNESIMNGNINFLLFSLDVCINFVDFSKWRNLRTGRSRSEGSKNPHRYEWRENGARCNCKPAVQKGHLGRQNTIAPRYSSVLVYRFLMNLTDVKILWTVHCETTYSISLISMGKCDLVSRNLLLH